MVPKLAAKARLRWDKREKRYLLIWPERGILLNDSAGAILSRVDGARTVDAIVADIATVANADAARIRADVEAFLEEMRKRGVIDMRESEKGEAGE